MLLRRISKHVKDQNWFAVALDFFIVVVGILIAFQITNWSERRTNEQREKQVLEEILDDLREDSTILQTSAEAAKLTVDSTNILLEFAELEPISRMGIPVQNRLISVVDVPPPTPLEANPTSQFWARITMRYFPERNSAAVDALIATGNFSIIQDPQIVRGLQRNTTLWENVTTSHNRTYRTIRDRAIFVGQRHGLSPFTTVDLDTLTEIVKTDPELLGAIRTNGELAAFHQQSMDTRHSNTDALIRRIEDALGIESAP